MKSNAKNRMNEKALEEVFKKHLQDQFFRGIYCGKVTIAKIIKDKLKDIKDDTPKEEAINIIKDTLRFCETTLSVDTNTDRELYENK